MDAELKRIDETLTIVRHPFGTPPSTDRMSNDQPYWYGLAKGRLLPPFPGACRALGCHVGSPNHRQPDNSPILSPTRTESGSLASLLLPQHCDSSSVTE